mmetsp:Transcript_19773/g.41429  ORF Transcript_19773/g.41429 Transcript_19773/m.41429 type:complete len:91 (-) Transcript_19773:412-684(-)
MKKANAFLHPRNDANNRIANHHDANGFIEGGLRRDPREGNTGNTSLDNKTMTTLEATTPSSSPVINDNSDINDCRASRSNLPFETNNNGT